jgi:hypothetical protein
VAALVWGSFGFLVVATAGGIGFAAVRGLDAWRALRSLRRALGDGLVEVAAGVAAVESRLAHGTESAARLDEARARLQHSLATAAVLAEAAGDARSALRVLSLLRR